MPEAFQMSSAAAAAMPSPPVSYVHSRAVRYQPCLVDLRWRRSVHSCDTCPFRSGSATFANTGTNRRLSATASGSESCNSVHYGVCTPLKPGAVVPSSSPATVQKPAAAVVTGPATTPAPATGSVGLNGANAAGTGVTPTVVATSGAADRPESPPPPPLPAKKRTSGAATSPSAPSVGTAAAVPTTAGSPVSPPPSSVKDGSQQQQPPQLVSSPTTATVAAPVAERSNAAISAAAGGSATTQQTPAPAVVSGASRSTAEPNGQSFLRKKEKELQEKREREAAAAAGATPANRSVGSTPSSVGDRRKQDAGTVSPDSTGPPIASSEPEIQRLPSDFSGSRLQDSTGAVSPPTPADQPGKTVAAAGPKAAAKVTSTGPSLPAAAASTAPALPVPGSAANLPQFYFPNGVAMTPDQNEAALRKVKEEIDKIEGGKVLKTQIGPIVKALGLPFYWKCLFFNFAGGDKAGHVTLQGVLAAWRKLTASCMDDAAKFIRLMAKPNRQTVEFEDFVPFVQDVVDTHPGLIFLQDAPEFHSRYVQTVIARIFYTVNRSWSGRISAAELRKSNFLQILVRLETEDDINQITDYFSYEHFYVIYCKFWELDKDHDLYISREDLARHSDHAISSRIIDRIFSGAVTRNLVDGKLSYRDFVWFIISEEDKRNPRSIEYWFRCMDMDGDGIISMYEMEYFYEEQVEKMEMLGIETLPFQDCLCQMLDMIRPQEEGRIRLRDLKACKLTPIFFDTFINLDKYLEHEQKDPFSSIRDQDSDEPEPTDWDRYAAEEYEVLVAEEGASDNRQEATYEDDLEPGSGDGTTPNNADSESSRSTSVDSVGSTSQSKKSSAGSSAGSSRTAGNVKKDNIYDLIDP